MAKSRGIRKAWAERRRLIVSDYIAGMAWEALMVKYDVVRSTITCSLHEAGISRVNGRQAMKHVEHGPKRRKRPEFTGEQRWERFWSRVTVGSRVNGLDSECWLWTGPTETGGYGRVGPERAHRMALRLEGIKVRKGWDVCHRCDNPPCCNPAHLVHAPRRINHHDKLRKGRHHRRLNMPLDKLIPMPSGMGASLAI